MLKSYLHKDLVEAGCDEAGRGCLAGPVYAAAVILPKNYKNKKLDDSKKLKLSDRLQLRSEIEKKAIAWAVGIVTEKEIDQINILNASFLAMHRAVDQLTVQPEHLLIDGNRFNPYKDFSFDCIIKGDGKYLSIAAASILAKTYRDDYMCKIHEEFPHFDWKKNNGYPTPKHREMIAKHGDTVHHRQSFQLLPLPKQTSLF